ncbi:MAG: c-type cytochrome domain-containing protein [Pirellulales bacterium]
MSVLAVCSAATLARAVEKDEPVDFSRDIRPLMSNACYTCHGPSVSARVTDLRLDLVDGIDVELGSGEQLVVPGNAAE